MDVCRPSRTRSFARSGQAASAGLYGVPGDSLNGLTDALRRDGDLQRAHVRNEEVAAFAAGAEAQLTGELAVCVGSYGPGNVHLINGLYDAGRSHAPVLATARAPTDRGEHKRTGRSTNLP